MTQGGFFYNLFNKGTLPELQTSVEVEQQTFINGAAALFIAAFLVFLTWYVFKKIS